MDFLSFIHRVGIRPSLGVSHPRRVLWERQFGDTVRHWFFQLIVRQSRLLWLGLLVASPALQLLGNECKSPSTPPPKLTRKQTYASVPFKQGEEAKYELKYGALKVLVGYGFLRVRPPVKYGVNAVGSDGKPESRRLYHRVFQAEAFTGEWYKMIFVAHDKILAYSRPWDFSVTKFYISQDEHKPFSRNYRREKWLEFDHQNCQAKTKEIEYTKANKTINGVYHYEPGSIDALSAFYKLRTFTYQLGKEVKFPVYTSEKNWLLEAKPLAFEVVTVGAGRFQTVKLDLKTYLGEDLQQKGKVQVWVATEHPHRPVVKIEGEVTIGHVYLELDKFTEGNK